MRPAPELSPAEALEPFRPGVDGDWDRAAAAHLARRATFGMAPRLVEQLLAMGPADAAASLLEPRPELEDVLFAAQVAEKVGSLEAAQGAWIYRMLRGAWPAREKLTLFWHGHFATSERKVESLHLMLRQIELFRTRGTGPFEALLQEVARDPAMIIWLDGNLNRKGKPNENFARELMELFSLGIGNYSEHDIKEAARAFTGWHVKEDELWFNARAHDEGEKVVFGERGPWNGDQVVHLCAARPASAELIAGKLYEFYVQPHPSAELRRVLGKQYALAGGDTSVFLRRLWSSRIFFARASRRALVSTPIDFAVGSLATLEATANGHAVASAARAMGQELFAPPSVKGWDMGMAWLSSTTLLARYRFALGVAQVEGMSGAKDLGCQAAWDGLPSGEKLLERFFPEGLPPDVASALQGAPGRDARAFVAECLQLPEYQFV